MSTVLAGTWKASPRAGKVCTYSSDRGAIFAIQEVRGPDAQAGLAAARSSCSSKPHNVPATASFACVERQDGADLVVGNIIARERLWIFVIIPAGGGNHDGELSAMTALLRVAR